MKKNAVRAIAALCASLLLILSLGILRKVAKAAAGEAQISTMPSFTFSTVSGRVFNSDSIQKSPVLIIYFHPECEHCRYEISSVISSGLTDGRAVILLVTFAGEAAVRTFISELSLEDEKSIWVVSDTLLRFKGIFGNRQVPTNIIYGSDRKLLKIFPGETKAEAIITYLNGET